MSPRGGQHRVANAPHRAYPPPSARHRRTSSRARRYRSRWVACGAENAGLELPGRGRTANSGQNTGHSERLQPSPHGDVAWQPLRRHHECRGVVNRARPMRGPGWGMELTGCACMVRWRPRRRSGRSRPGQRGSPLSVQSSVLVFDCQVDATARAGVGVAGAPGWHCSQAMSGARSKIPFSGTALHLQLAVSVVHMMR